LRFADVIFAVCLAMRLFTLRFTKAGFAAGPIFLPVSTRTLAEPVRRWPANQFVTLNYFSRKAPAHDEGEEARRRGGL
jgi:hypothetical protein